VHRFGQQELVVHERREVDLVVDVDAGDLGIGLFGCQCLARRRVNCGQELLVQLDVDWLVELVETADAGAA
jgi:hypothetical protein